MNSAPPSDSTPPLVYLVDDDFDMLESTKFLIQSAGYRCMAYTNARQFICEYDPIPIGCCIFDLQLGELNEPDGLELARDFLSRAPTHPVIFLTGFGTIAKAVQAIRIGAFDFIEKPIDHTTLLDCVQRGIELDRKRRAEQGDRDDRLQKLSTLTLRELEVLKLVSEGLLTKQIASKLQISQKTVEVHRSHINRKLGFRSTVQMVKWISELHPPIQWERITPTNEVSFMERNWNSSND